MCVRLVGLLALSLLGTRAIAADLELPSNPAQWINSWPVSVEQMSGKAIVLYFFEEGCPKCRGKWPGLMESAARFQGEPVMFVAVNSGSSRRAIETYVRETGLTWPVIVDPDRRFEKAAGLTPEISLNNIHQLRYVDAEGRLHVGGANEMAASVDKALEGAAWNVDPKTMPEELLGVWQAIEFGNYAVAAVPIRKFLKSSKPETKQAADALMAVVQGEIDESFAAAKLALDEGRKFDAYLVYESLPDRFGRFELPEDVTRQTKELAADTDVKEELAAMKILNRALTLSQTSPANRKRAVAALRKLVENSPETKAGIQAAEILGAETTMDE